MLSNEEFIEVCEACSGTCGFSYGDREEGDDWYECPYCKGQGVIE